MTNTGYIQNVLTENLIYLTPVVIVGIIYLACLRRAWKYRLLVASPGIIFILVSCFAIVLVILAPDTAYSVAFIAIPDLIALILIVFNIFYVRTWLHLLQIINVPTGLFCFFIAGMTITHTGL